MAGMRAGFTKSGQPIQGRKYTVTQGDISIPVTVVGKLFGRGGASNLVGVILQEPSGARDTLPWPLEASDGAEPIYFTSGWPAGGDS